MKDTNDCAIERRLKKMKDLLDTHIAYIYYVSDSLADK